MLMAPLLGLVLAGGESRRMGRDKGRLHWKGTEQRLRCAALLQSCCAGVFLSLRAEESIPGVAVLADRYPGIGPMSGLLTAFGHRPDAAWLVVACDLPLLAEAAISQLVAGRRPGVLATCFRDAQGAPEPLLTIWEPAAKPLLESAFAEARYSPRAVLQDAAVHSIVPAASEWLFNTNTPEEWAQALARG